MKLTRSRWIKLEGNTEAIGGLPQLKHAFSGKANRMLLDRKDNNPQSGGKWWKPMQAQDRARYSRFLWFADQDKSHASSKTNREKEVVTILGNGSLCITAGTSACKSRCPRVISNRIIKYENSTTQNWNTDKLYHVLYQITTWNILQKAPIPQKGFRTCRDEKPMSYGYQCWCPLILIVETLSSEAVYIREL